ncbi:ABC transporter ATP-binding protein [Halobacillus litoralis]|nr:ABC transporter ATP-binding protein [Halobacillus litoralis]
MLEAMNCSVDISGERILSDLSFKVHKGEMLALVGHNGAGKSTLIKAMIGTREKSSGKFTICSIDQDDQFKEYKEKFAYIPEEPLLLSELTVAHHFKLYQKSYHIPDELFEKRVKVYTEAFELEDKLNDYPEALSKGMRQKVQTICALLPEVPLLFIDEPFMGLDIYAGNFLEKELRQRCEEGISIVLTTHQLDKVRSLADSFIMLANGGISASGSVESFDTLERRDTQ